MDLSHRIENDIVIVSVTGKLDTTTSASFDTYLRDAASAEVKHCILAFDKLDYISSAGLRSVLMAAKLFGAKKGKVVLSGLSGAVKDVFSLSGFDRVVPLCENESAALALIQPGA